MNTICRAEYSVREIQAKEGANINVGQYPSRRTGARTGAYGGEEVGANAHTQGVRAVREACISCSSSQSHIHT